MAQPTLRAQDVLNGAYGAVYLVENGQRELVINCQEIVAEVKKNKQEIKVLGTNVSKQKAVGWSGTGTMTMYYGTSKLREIMGDYINQGIDKYFQLVISNNDPSSDIGTQTIALNGVNFDNTTMAKLDVNNTKLDEQISFTFQGVEILEKFKTYQGE